MMLDIERNSRDLYLTIWYEENKWHLKAIRLFNKPNTLSGQILRLNSNPPLQAGFWEINGNRVQCFTHAPPLPEQPPHDNEDVDEVTANLPVVTFQRQIHFRKCSKYRNEIANLLLSQGGSCPGTQLSPHLVQLLGADSEGCLVFRKLSPWQSLDKYLRSIAAYKRCLIQIISGLSTLHSVGIVHRDIRLDNLLFDEDNRQVVICDLESRWGNRLALEIQDTTGHEGVWTVKTDIFDLGSCLRDLIYMNSRILPTVDWIVPPPFDRIVAACVQQKPEDRPSLIELRSMVEEIRDTEPE